MAVTIEQLEREAEEIRTNSLPSSNTAELVGQHLLHIKEYLKTHGSQNLYYSIDGISKHTITNRLTNCTNSSNKTSVNLNASYTATLTAKAGYTMSSVVITMGGTDVTSSVYSGGVITIERVTGDVIITATASADSTAGLFDNATWLNAFWSLSDNNTPAESATPSSTKNYLSTEFFGVPNKKFTIAAKTISGYLVGFRFYLCRSVDGNAAKTVTKSSAYGKISGAVAQSVTTDTIKALDDSAPFFSISIWAKATSGSGNLDLSEKTFSELITVQ